MFHKVKEVFPQADLMLNVMFADGTTKEYDVAPLLEGFEAFAPLADGGCSTQSALTLVGTAYLGMTT